MYLEKASKKKLDRFQEDGVTASGEPVSVGALEIFSFGYNFNETRCPLD